MSAEPEDVAGVEGDKPETCPTCGGLCTKDPQTPVEMAMMATPHYRSLVQGEVAVEGWRECAVANDITTLGNEYLRVYKDRPSTSAVRVLVFKAKESQHDRREGTTWMSRQEKH